MVDFYPIIEKIHLLHRKHEDENLSIEYNAMFNYWQDSRTYNDRQIKISKIEHLSQSANKLINRIQIRLQERSRDLSLERDYSKKIRIAYSIKADCEIYLNTILCFIHSKASLEISSFKADTTLAYYTSFLYDLIWNIYSSIVSYRESYKSLDADSLLYSLALENSDEIYSFTNMIPCLSSLGDLRLRYLSSQKYKQDWVDGLGRRNKIDWRAIDNNELSLAKIFRDLMYKIVSVIELLQRLKDENMEWDSSSESVSQLMALIEQNTNS